MTRRSESSDSDFSSQARAKSEMERAGEIKALAHGNDPRTRATRLIRSLGPVRRQLTDTGSISLALAPKVNEESILDALRAYAGGETYIRKVEADRRVQGQPYSSRQCRRVLKMLTDFSEEYGSTGIVVVTDLNPLNHQKKAGGTPEIRDYLANLAHETRLHPKEDKKLPAIVTMGHVTPTQLHDLSGRVVYTHSLGENFASELHDQFTVAADGFIEPYELRAMVGVPQTVLSDVEDGPAKAAFDDSKPEIPEGFVVHMGEQRLGL